MNTDLDDALRAMLRERAQDITTVPERVSSAADLEDIDGAEVLELLPPTRSGHRRWTIGLSAAIVAAVVCGIVAFGQTKNSKPDSVPPASVMRTACDVAATPEWNAALTRARIDVPGAAFLSTQGITSEGDTVISYQAADGSFRFATIAPGASTLRDVATVAVGASLSEGPVSGHWITLIHDRKIPERGSGGYVAQPYRLSVLDIDTGEQKVVTTSNRLSEQTFIQGDELYYMITWPKRAEIVAYDLATGNRRVVVNRSLRATDAPYLDGGAAGVWWTQGRATIDRPARVPAVVAAHLAGPDADDVTVGGVDRSSFVTDGTAWAWRSPAGVIDYWSATTGQLVRIPGLLHRLGFMTNGEDAGYVSSVAGPFVEVQLPARELKSGNTATARIVLLDTRTGAMTRIPEALQLTFARNGVLYGQPHGPNVITHVPKFGTMIRLDTATLPELHC